MNEDKMYEKLSRAVLYLDRAFKNHYAMHGQEMELSVAIDSIINRFEPTINRLALRNIDES
jgi:hypothetical protein